MARLEASEEMQLQAARLKLRLETTTAGEHDAFRRRNKRAFLGLKHWLRLCTHAKNDKAALYSPLEASSSASTAHGSAVGTAALRKIVAKLQERVDKLDAASHTQAATVAALRARKVAAN